MRKKNYHKIACRRRYYRNRKSSAMIHSRIKWLHTKEDTTTKQKTIRSQNTISEKYCRDITKINRQRKHEGFDRSLPKLKLCLSRNRWKGQCCSLPKKRTREVVLQSRLFKGQNRAGRGSVLWKGLRRMCEEGWWRVRCEQKIRGARWVELELAVGVWGERAGDGAGNS